MKKTELKQVLKPLIKECIKEVIFEEGILSGLITEVARGLNNIQPIPEVVVKKPQKTNGKATQQATQQLNEIKQQMQKATGLSGIFEGTTASPQHKGKNAKHGPMRDRDPNDAGINIDGLVKMTGGWNHLK